MASFEKPTTTKDTKDTKEDEGNEKSRLTPHKKHHDLMSFVPFVPLVVLRSIHTGGTMKSLDPHRERVLDTDNPYVGKRPVEGHIVCVLHARSERRGMQLEPHPSRAVPAGEIHELAVTDDPAAVPGAQVERVAYVGFFEIARGGVILAGDAVCLDGRELGRVAGFDCTHFPNHMNILVFSPQRQTGKELGATVEAPVTFG
jgi:hypothetical protein